MNNLTFKTGILFFGSSTEYFSEQLSKKLFSKNILIKDLKIIYQKLFQIFFKLIIPKKNYFEKNYFNFLFSPLIFCALIFCGLPTVSRSQIIYVAQFGTGDGSSWQKAQSSLVKALAQARPKTQVWVMKGTYYPTQCTACSVNDRRQAFNFPDGVSVIGGFSGFETTPTQRDIKNAKTILSGDIDRDGFSNNNSYSVIYTYGLSSKSVVDGFTITGGNANDTTAAVGEINSSGGGWFNDCRDTVSEPTIRNCTFTGNSAIGFGGGLFNNMYKGKCGMQVQNCIFSDNYSHSVGGAVNNFAVDSGFCTAHFEYCNFVNNKSDESGGAVSNDGERGSNLSVYINCSFIHNECPYSDSIITYGGAMYNLGKNGTCSPSVINCLFWANKAYGGAIYCLGYKGKCNPQITNCIFYKNEAHTCGSIYSNAGDSSGNASPTIVNSIFQKNKAALAPIFRNIYGTPHISYSIVDTTSCAGTHSGLGSGTVCGAGMIYNEDPIFSDPENGDFRLKPGSPAINSGNTAIVNTIGLLYDLDSLPRVLKSIVDIGCYEFTGLKFFQPEIVTHPTDKIICEKTNTYNKIKASGTPPLIYDWYKNDTLFKAAGTDTLFVNNATASSAGYYKCIVRNNIGQAAATFPALLTVRPLLPVSVSLETVLPPKCEGDSITLKARTFNGGKTQRLIWLLNGVSLGLPDSAAVITVMAGSRYFKYNCQLISSEVCVQQNYVPSNFINVSDLINTKLTATLNTLNVSRASYCINDKVHLEATGTNWGYAPQIDWYKNGKTLNYHLPYLIIDNLHLNDTVSVSIISSESCADKFTPTDQFVNSRSDNCLNGHSNASRLQPIIFPNPSTTSHLTIEHGDWSGRLRIDVLATDGRMLQTTIIPNAGAQNTTDFDTGVAANGLYFIRLSSDTDSKMYKWFFAR